MSPAPLVFVPQALAIFIVAGSVFETKQNKNKSTIQTELAKNKTACTADNHHRVGGGDQVPLFRKPIKRNTMGSVSSNTLETTTAHAALTGARNRAGRGKDR